MASIPNMDDRIVSVSSAGLIWEAHRARQPPTSLRLRRQRWARLRGLSRRQAEGCVKEFVDSPGLRSCPFAGKRAPEMAAGKLLDVFDRLVAQSMGDAEAR